MTRVDGGGSPICDKTGCDARATVQIVLRDPDGTVEWLCCEDHAMAFSEWTLGETLAQRGTLNVTYRPDEPWSYAPPV